MTCLSLTEWCCRYRFAVLKGACVPAVLKRAMCLSNSEDDDSMMTRWWQDDDKRMMACRCVRRTHRMMIAWWHVCISHSDAVVMGLPCLKVVPTLLKRACVPDLLKGDAYVELTGCRHVYRTHKMSKSWWWMVACRCVCRTHRPCGKQHLRVLPTPDWASPLTKITYCWACMTHR